MTRIEELLTMMETNTCKRHEALELVRLVREERERCKLRMAECAHRDMCMTLPRTRLTKEADRLRRAIARVQRILRGEPAFGGGR